MINYRTYDTRGTLYNRRIMKNYEFENLKTKSNLYHSSNYGTEVKTN